MEQLRRVLMIIGVQAVVPHDHAVNHRELPVDLAQMIRAVMVPHLPGGFLRLRVRGKEMQVGVDNIHGASSF